MNSIFNGIRRLYHIFALSYGLIVILTLFGNIDIFSNYFIYLDISYFLITILAIYRQFQYYKQLKILMIDMDEKYVKYAEAFFYLGSFVLIFYYFLISFFNPNSLYKWEFEYTTVVVINDFDINMGLFAITFAILWIITMIWMPKQLLHHSNIWPAVKPLMSTKILTFPPEIDENITLPEGSGKIPANLRILALIVGIIYSALMGFWVLLKLNFI